MQISITAESIEYTGDNLCEIIGMLPECNLHVNNDVFQFYSRYSGNWLLVRKGDWVVRLAEDAVMVFSPSAYAKLIGTEPPKKDNEQKRKITPSKFFRWGPYD